MAWATDATGCRGQSHHLVYDHHKSNLTDKMIDIQHAHGDRVVSSMHIHLNHDLCMELIALRGPAAEIQTLGG